MSTPLICHLLIGCPGSGKSTFAALLAKQGNYKIVSTDQIREALYGDESIQGDWSAIEARVLSEIQSAIASNQPVIYDATNAKRVWRMELLMKLHSDPPPTPPYQGRENQTSFSYSQKHPHALILSSNQEQEYQTPLSNSPLVEENPAKTKDTSNSPLVEENPAKTKDTSNSPLNKGGWGGETGVASAGIHSYETPLSHQGRGVGGEGDSVAATSTKIHWIVWHLTTPLETCKAWNRKRKRRVPDVVIEGMYKSLQEFPPIPAEGFAAVNPVKPTPEGFNIAEIQEKIQRLSRTLTNRTNRTLHRKITLHRYSRFLDFDRLLRLIALVIRYPGIGALHSTAPRLLEKILGRVPNFATPLEEICAIMHVLQGAIYSNAEAIAADLQWLEQNGLIGSENIDTDITVPHLDDPNLVTHAYSDVEPFKRLLKTIRFILHHPFLPKSGNSSLVTLVDALKAEGIINGDGLDTVRKDIERILKPYKILPEFPLRQGYFAGTGILSRHELRKVFAVLQSQAKSLDDPVALATYEMFKERVTMSQLDTSDVYPVRAIGNRCIIETSSLPSSALSNNVEKLEEAIEQGKLLELKRIAGSGRLDGDEAGFFLAWPLQIVFHNLAWYLGFECAEGKDANLFQFERLDRLFFGRPQRRKRDRQTQEKSLRKLRRLYEASAGLFLGYSASDQQQFLSPNQSERSAVEVTVELWFNDPIFRFVSEGTKRFPPQQMKMSPPLGSRATASRAPNQSIFSLPQTKDPNFPNRFRVKLPKWTIFDADLLRWIVGFGGNVKVVQPTELVEKIKATGEAICQVYRDEPQINADELEHHLR